MDFLIDLWAKAQGLTGWVMDLVPLLGAAGGLLGVAGSVLTRAGAVHDPAGLLHALHPTADELAIASASAAVLRAHFKHQAIAASVAAAQGVNLPNQKP